MASQLASATSNDGFYDALPSFDRFIDITVSSNFVPVPEDWYIVVTDIVHSTEAIQQGRYKEVNFLGACTIVALLNCAGQIDIPFVFGGDGASVLIPGFLVPQAQQALLANQRVAQQDFNLELRVGIVPVSVVTADYDLLIAKLRVSENYSQAVFRGGGLSYATDLVKNVATGKLYQLDAQAIMPKADFSGLECRWKAIPSQYGEIVSLIVLATAPSETQKDRIYQEVIRHIEKLYGANHQFNPIVPNQIHLSFQQQHLLLETKVKSSTRTWWSRQRCLLKLRLENLLGLVLMTLGVKSPAIDWGQYKTIVAEASDYRKFDDILRMVFSSRPSQRQQLEKFLEKKYQEGRLVYGLHCSDSALMTCLVFERGGQQVHFVDGGDGGYALAAKAMKQRIKA